MYKFSLNCFIGSGPGLSTEEAYQVELSLAFVHDHMQVLLRQVEVSRAELEGRIFGRGLEEVGRQLAVLVDAHRTHLDRREDPSVDHFHRRLVATLESSVPKFDHIFGLLLRQKVRNSFSNCINESLKVSFERVTPGPAVRHHKLELVLGLAGAVVHFEGEVGNFFGQLLEVICQLRAVFNHDVAVLPVGEVILQ